ncbi:MAG: DUF692 domain-containing protein, partial [Alphaproteobacteria bacterium]
PEVGWFEIHTENYMGAGGPAQTLLAKVAADYPLSCHGVGLSLGSAEGLDSDHLERVAAVIERYQPTLVSEHLSWCRARGDYLNDLLPLPLTREALEVTAGNIDRFQDRIGRQVLVENPSSYLEFEISEMSEPEFLSELVARTGCGILLDINNIYVSAHNNGWDAEAYLRAIPADAVGEFHLAGHATRTGEGWQLLIDDHGSRVPEAVWSLYEQALTLIGRRPTLIEWDTNVPSLTTLVDEASQAQRLLDRYATAEASL